MKISKVVGKFEVLTTLIILILAGLLIWIAMTTNNNDSDINAGINSYEECVAAGYPIAESFPEQCVIPGGPSFTRQLPDSALSINQDENSDEVTQLPSLQEEANLEAVGSFIGNGSAIRTYNGEIYTLRVTANLDDPAEGKFYEGWVVNGSVVSTGQLIREGGIYLLEFTSLDDLSGHNEVIITEETSANGLDGIPEDHVLEGSF